jgi:ATP-dependent Clp protease adaptor protein ClpS
MATQLENQSELLTREPRQYAVFMLNDDYTTWEFCVRIICTVFHKNVLEADAITHDIHTKGKGLCGVYPYEIAETKASLVQQQARKEGFPMCCSVEEQ